MTFLSCDWGTSSFRLRWVAGTNVLREHRDSTGCKTLHDRALATGVERPRLYAEFLLGLLDRWTEFAPTRPIPLVISGMASSTIGWCELPYAPVPIALNASNLRFEKLKWASPNWVRDTFLISGAASDHDIMRGEETEAIGLLAHRCNDCLLILPGTHSKHLQIAGGRIVNFATHMTGELFDVLARNSILRATTDIESLAWPAEANLAAFDSGVSQAVREGLGPSLFQTRTRAILHGSPAAENTWFLSGLLIGAELAGLTAKRPEGPILVGGASRLRALYSRALRVLRVEGLQEAAEDELEHAVPRAHALFLQHTGL